MTVAELSDEIAAYELMHADLEAAHLGEWALVHDRQLVGTFDSFDKAAREAIRKFGRGPYLIRQVGSPRPIMQAHVGFSGIAAVS
jgi:hypothetical protein